MSSDTPSDLSGSSIAFTRNKESSVVAVPDRLTEDVSSLRADINQMQDILSKFVSEAGGQAARTARNVGHTVASQLGSTASGLATSSADVASSARDQFKTFATELEGIARKNPLGALAGALAVGIVIGLIVRGRG
jgi:ElaB/YqjD/DUF883 family membrane-anchored ribosome-binding protein